MRKGNYNSMKNIYGQKGFIMCDRVIAERFGINESILLGDLINSGSYWEDRYKLAEDGFFFKTREDIQKSCYLTPAAQRTALPKLVEAGLVETTKRGIPSVMCYRVNRDILESILSSERKDEDEEDIHEEHEGEKEYNHEEHEENKPLIDKVDKKPKSRREKPADKAKKTLDMVASKLSLTDFSEEVINELLDKFYPRIVNTPGKTVNEDTVDYDIAQLSKCKDDKERMELLELIRHKGWKSIDYDYFPKKNTGSKFIDTTSGYGTTFGITKDNMTNEQKDDEEERSDNFMKDFLSRV